MINSTTILLPTWKELLEDLELKVKLMPRDVRTRWNSTYTMLNFSLEYRKAIEHITSERKNDLRRFKLSEEEWDIVWELSDMLKVGPCGSMFETSHALAMSHAFSANVSVRNFPLPRSSRMRQSFFHEQHQTLPRLSRLWITSTRTSPTRSTPTMISIQQSTLLLVWARKL